MKKIMLILTLVLAFGSAWEVKSLNTTETFPNNEKFFEKNILIAQSLSQEDIYKILDIHLFTAEELKLQKKSQKSSVLNYGQRKISETTHNFITLTSLLVN